MERRPGLSNLRRGRRTIPGQIYFITTVTLERVPFFKSFEGACAAARCFHGSGVMAWVLMPDHAHWLLQLEEESLDESVMRLKSLSARATNTALHRAGPIWQRGYHDRALRRDEDIVTAARYLVANPLRAGLAKILGDYPCWNATWL
jgi:putative transposase